MKSWICTILIIGVLSVGRLSAQTVTGTDVAGTYHVAFFKQANSNTQYDYEEAKEKPIVDSALAVLKQNNPAYALVDSANTVMGVSFLYAMFSTVRCTFKANGTYFIGVGDGNIDTLKWFFDKEKLQIIIDGNTAIKEVWEIENRAGKIYLIQKGNNGSVTEYIKE